MRDTDDVGGNPRSWERISRRRMLATGALAAASLSGCLGGEAEGQEDEEVQRLRRRVEELERQLEEERGGQQERQNSTEERREDAGGEQTELPEGAEEAVVEYVRALQRADVDTLNALHHPDGKMQRFEPRHEVYLGDDVYRSFNVYVEREIPGLREYRVVFEYSYYTKDEVAGEPVESKMELRQVEDGVWRVFDWSWRFATGHPLLGFVGLKPDDVEGLRYAWIEGDRIVVATTCAGEDRSGSDCQESLSTIRSNPYYVSDYDVPDRGGDFEEGEYAHVEFKVPREYQELADRLEGHF